MGFLEVKSVHEIFHFFQKNARFQPENILSANKKKKSPEKIEKQIFLSPKGSRVLAFFFFCFKNTAAS